ncbi:MAG TPA: glycosyltransferase N-terminal domain-containing protein [Bacteroidia bacterium]|nr:glycosyltransferase N-terminal domain-containing protein [Bacteroidia bacterium]
MPLLYNLGIKAYSAAVSIAALWNEKARKWTDGRKNIFEQIQQALPVKVKKRLWMHVASLGEFEQGLPVIEKFNRDEWEIITTFFSPSGYEYRKNHKAADAVFYLPVDSKGNAAKFLDSVQADLVIFVKYDFWYYYLTEVRKRNIPLYLISALFREKQPFFRGSKLHREMLLSFNHIFTQDENSVKLLKSHGYSSASQAGDTRCDRVLQNALVPKKFTVIENFIGGTAHLSFGSAQDGSSQTSTHKKVLVAGSSWPEEEELLAAVYNGFKDELKLIIAPHNINDAHISEIEKSFEGYKIARYSKLTEATAAEYDIVIIDNIGMLSSLYQYGDVAMIGGAFRKGLHNILEAAVFEIPVIYGPPVSKYPEGRRLVAAGGGFIVNNKDELTTLLSGFLSQTEKRVSAGKKARAFIEDNAGAAGKIYERIQV